MENKTSLNQTSLKTKARNRMIKVKRFLFGIGESDGFILKTVIYLLLIGIGFVFLYPVLYMLINSMMSLEDLVNTMVKWVPTSLHLENYKVAFEVLDYPKTLLQSFVVAGVPSIFQCISCAIVGYGFARFEFPLKRTLFVIMLATFIVPSTLTMIPNYILFNEYGLLGSLKSFIYPALLANGIKSSLFILIYFQFFKQLSNSIEEAAQIDGANQWTIFYRLAIPMAVPAIIIVFLFSFVWYWNEAFLASLYLGDSFTTLPLELQRFVDSFAKKFPASAGVTGQNAINEAIKMAGTVLTILPMLVVYFFLQRWFVEGIDRTGVTGE
jgi:multiple sugar transport system permease protein